MYVSASGRNARVRKGRILSDDRDSCLRGPTAAEAKAASGISLAKATEK